MQKNWYAVYTRPGYENKVALLLKKKGIENFCPFSLKKTQSLFRTKLIQEPVFKSYVFVKTSEPEVIELSKSINGIVSLLYWMGQPATINEDEITVIKNFTVKYNDIKLERLHSSELKMDNISSNITYTMDGKILLVKNREIKIKLPSLGYAMIATMKEDTLMGREIFGNKDAVLNS